MEKIKDKKVLLGMSGGVDSAVSAILLKNKGYEVLGATLDLYGINNKDYEDVKKICQKLQIEHYKYDLRKEFKNRVIDDFINCYASCKTPNPCIECNKYMKFGAMYEKAKEMGCYYIATGHYAKVEYSKKYSKWVLKKASAAKKDQSYVLWSIPKDILEHIIFPLGDFQSKEEIRNIASKGNLSVASKKDSEDICFIPDGNYKKFLEENSNIMPKEGNIVNREGKILGRHRGLYNYTIGQRKGLGISYKSPLFVLEFDKENNNIIVGEEKELYKKQITVTDVNLLLFDKIDSKLEVNVKTRYSSKEAKAIIYEEKNNIIVDFYEPQKAITKGQSAVFYIDDIVVGGGKIV